MSEINILGEVREFLGNEKFHEFLKGDNNFKSEFIRAKPKDEQELLDFYRESKGYLIANAQHHFPEELKEWAPGRLLDFGGGAGTHSFPMAMLGHQVDYCDIGVIQQEFMRWLANKYNIVPLLNVVSGPIGEYDYLVLADVIEHLADYRPVMKKLIEHLRVGGLAYLKPQFDEQKQDGMRIHWLKTPSFRQD